MRVKFAPQIPRLASTYVIEQGLTLAEIMVRVPEVADPRDWSFVTILVDGHRLTVPPSKWHRLRFKAIRDISLVILSPLGDEGVREVLGVVAAVALVAVGAAISGGALVPVLGSAFASGTLGANLAAAAVSLVGALAVGALTAPPAREALTPSADPQAAAQRRDAFARGNLLETGAPLPVAINQRTFPPLIGAPLVDMVEGELVVEAVYGLAGPADLADIRVNAAAIDDDETIDYETREGYGTDAPLSLVKRYGFVEDVNHRLKWYRLEDDTVDNLRNQASPTESVPKWYTVRSATDPDEVWVQLRWELGIVDTRDTTAAMAQPVRLRFRESGTAGAWINGPEIHIGYEGSGALDFMIKFDWSTAPTAVPDVPTTIGAIHAYHDVAAQTAADRGSTGGWQAANEFAASATIDDTENCFLYDDRAVLYMDNTQFPRGKRWDVQIINGQTYTQSNFTYASYNINGNVPDLFGWTTDGSGAHETEEEIEYYTGELTVVRVSSVINDPIVPEGSGLALIALRGINAQVSQISTKATRLVPTWSGSAWGTSLSASTNPAAQFRAILVDLLTRRGVSLDVIDDAGLGAWYDRCASAGYTVSTVITGEPGFDALALVAGAGWARPRAGLTYGVIEDRDTSAEAPVQLLTPANSRGFSIQKAFPVRPDGFRARFRDATRDHQWREILIYDDTRPTRDIDNLEAVTIEAIDTEADVIARLSFDLNVPNFRSAFYGIETDAASLLVAPGDVVAVQHDSISEQAGWGWIEAIETQSSNGYVTGIRLDRSVPVFDTGKIWDATDIFDLADIYARGRQTTAAIQLDTGTVITKDLSHKSDGDAGLLRFETAFAAPTGFAVGNAVAIGPKDAETARLKVLSIEGAADHGAKLTLVDEAPELFA